MGEIMNNRNRRSLANIIATIYAITALALYWMVFKSINYVLLFSIIISIVFVEEIVYRILPKKSAKKITTSKKTTKSTSENTLKKQLSEKELLTADINSLSGDDFEKICFLYFEDKGFNPVMTPKTGDHGVDLVIKDPKDGLKIAVQCKRHKETIGNVELLKLEGGKRFYRCPKTLFITTSNYTNKAKEYAEQCKMDIWNGLIVDDKIGRWKKEKLKNNG